jgi:hypothetical protein
MRARRALLLYSVLSVASAICVALLLARFVDIHVHEPAGILKFVVLASVVGGFVNLSLAFKCLVTSPQRQDQ